MNKTVIVFASKHHGNTCKLVNAIAERCNVALINAEAQEEGDLSEYDLIGFASGIEFGRFYDSVELFLKKNLPAGKKVFFLYTCARRSNRFTRIMEAEALKKNAVCMGEYGCNGYNTFGPWKLIGGMNKNHPDAKELNDAVHFCRTLIGM